MEYPTIKEFLISAKNADFFQEIERIFIRRTDGSQELLSDALKTLSPGELMLFYMSIFLAIQQNGKKNKVIILALRQKYGVNLSGRRDYLRFMSLFRNRIVQNA